MNPRLLYVFRLALECAIVYWGVRIIAGHIDAIPRGWFS
jgi:hypothetical protein